MPEGQASKSGKKLWPFGNKKKSDKQNSDKKFNEKPQADPTEAQELKIASKTLRKLNVKEIIPSAAISLAQKAASESHSLVVEVPQAHGFLVVCIDGYDIHDVVQIDNPRAENYDKQEVGQLSQLLIDSRKIASVTLAQDRANGFIALLPTQTTLENLMSIDSFADTADKKLFTWALLPNDIDENSPLEDQATRSINQDQCHASLNELLSACRDNTKPEFHVQDGEVTDVKIFDINNIQNATSNTESNSVNSESVSDQMNEDHSVNKQITNEKPTENNNQDSTASQEQVNSVDNKSTETQSEADLIDSVGDELGMGEDDPFGEANDSPVFADQASSDEETLSNNDLFTNNSAETPDESQVDEQSVNANESSDLSDDNSSADVNNDLNAKVVDGKYTEGRYRGLTQQQANEFIMSHGFDVSPTQADIDELTQDEHESALQSLIASDEERRDNTVKELNDFQLKSSDNDLDINANDNAIEQLLSNYVPYRFELKELKSDHDGLTESVNAKKTIMNDEMASLHKQNQNAILSSFQNNVRKLMNNTQKLFSLSNMDNYGKIRHSIENEYETKRAELQPTVKKKQDEIDVKFQQQQQAIGEAAKQQAILRYQREYQPVIDQKKAAVPDEVYRSIMYDRDQKINTMRTNRRNQARDYFDDKYNQLVVLYTNKYKNVVMPSEKNLFDHHQHQLDDYIDRNFNIQAQRDADLAEIARHSNQVQELSAKIEQQDTDWSKKYAKLEKDNQNKINQLMASAEQDSRAKDQEYRDKLANIQAESETRHQAELQHEHAMNDQKIQELEQRNKLQQAESSDKIRSLENQVTELKAQVEKANNAQDDAVDRQRKADNLTISSLKATNDAMTKRVQDSNNALNMTQQQLANTQKHQGTKLAIAAVTALVVGGAVGTGIEYVNAEHRINEVQQVQKQQQVNNEKQEEQNNNTNHGQQTQPIINYNVGGGAQQTPKANSSSNK